MPSSPPLSPTTLAAQALHYVDGETRELVPPIRLGTTYARDPDYRLVGPGYTRDENPTYQQPEALLARLEEGRQALLFSSGMAAATTLFQACLRPGDRVAAPRVMYFGLRGWLQAFCARYQIELLPYDTHDPVTLGAALDQGPRLVWAETPANPTLDVLDLRASAEAAHQAGALFAVDSTVATPVHTRPLQLGADVVMHAATKALNGHGDVLAGALVAREVESPWWQEVRRLRHDQGAVLGPFEAFLLLRGMRTLYLRAHRQAQTALWLAERLEGHPRLVRVLYPGLAGHPGHAIAARQMEHGFGGLLSLRVQGGAAGALEVAKALRVFLPATSLGGVESLVEHRFTVEGAGTVSPEDLLRLSVGIEEPDDLLGDLLQALG